MPIISGNEFIWGSRTYSMGIINVTPDSFSNDGILNNIKKIQTKAKLFQSSIIKIVHLPSYRILLPFPLDVFHPSLDSFLEVRASERN